MWSSVFVVPVGGGARQGEDELAHRGPRRSCPRRSPLRSPRGRARTGRREPTPEAGLASARQRHDRHPPNRTAQPIVPPQPPFRAWTLARGRGGGAEPASGGVEAGERAGELLGVEGREVVDALATPMAGSAGRSGRRATSTPPLAVPSSLVMTMPVTPAMLPKMFSWASAFCPVGRRGPGGCRAAPRGRASSGRGRS